MNTNLSIGTVTSVAFAEIGGMNIDTMLSRSAAIIGIVVGLLTLWFMFRGPRNSKK